MRDSGSVPLRVILPVRPLPATDSAPHPLLPCARPSSGQVAEGTHHISAEGTGVEPYTPWPPIGGRLTRGPRSVHLRDATPSSHPGPARVLRSARHAGRATRRRSPAGGFRVLASDTPRR